MFLILAALAGGQCDVSYAPTAGPSHLIAAAVQTLVENQADFVNAVTLTQPVSSPREAAVITATAHRLASEHDLTVHVSERAGHLRLRLVRHAEQQESLDAEE